MKINTKKRLLSVKPYQPGRPIDEVKRELGLKQVIKLASNENPFEPSPFVLQALKKASQHVNRYPDGGCYYLRQALAKRLKISPEQLIFGNGSDEIIIMALRAFVEEGDEVIMTTPSFLVYKIGSRVVGASLKEIPARNFQYSLDEMAQAITSKTKIIFIANPDNPLGTYISEKSLRKFLKGIRKDILVFLDEAYYEYVLEKDYPQTISYLKDYTNILITRTFSKLYGLAGLRVGYGIARPALIDTLNRVREPFNVNALAQVAALACLKDQKYYKKIAFINEEQRQFLYQELDKLDLCYVRTATNFILIDVKQPSTPMVQQLLAKGIIVRDMTAWGMKKYIRVTIGKTQENKLFIKALKDILSGT